MLTYIKVKGVWKYLYPAVDKEGKTIAFLLTAKRDKAAAMRIFNNAIQANGTPEKITMEENGSSKAAIEEINESMEVPMIIRQVKYLNNIVEQDQRAPKRITNHCLDLSHLRQRKAFCPASN